MDGTVAEMRADDCTVKLAETPQSLTDDTPVKPEPMIRICAPVLPKPGEKPVTFGAPPPEAVTVKFEALVPVPAPVETEIFPVVAPDGTEAVIFTLEFTV